MKPDYRGRYLICECGEQSFGNRRGCPACRKLQETNHHSRAWQVSGFKPPADRASAPISRPSHFVAVIEPIAGVGESLEVLNKWMPGAWK